MKDDFCVAFLKRVFPSFFENPARLTNDWHFKFGENLQRLFITKRSFELAGVDVCLSFTLEFEQTMDLFEDKTFNYLGKKGLYCNAHKKQNMVNVLSKKCAEERCNKNPGFNYPDQSKGLYCVSHKKEGMINLLKR